MMDLLHLRQRDECRLSQRRTSALVRPNEHEGEEREVNRGRIDIGRISAHGAALLELFDSLEHRGWRQPHTTAQLRIRDAGIGLQCFENGEEVWSIMGINLPSHRRNVNCLD